MRKYLAISLILSLTGVLARAADEAPAGTEKLQIKLPKPMFVGTPKALKTPNLEPARGEKPRPPVYVPVGTALLSKKAAVTGSDKEPIIGSLDLITDGDKEGSEGSYVEMGPGVQWVQIDLGKVAEINAIVVWHFHSESRVYHDVVIQIADDPDFITNVQTVFNNDHDNSAGLGIGKDLEYIETYEGRPIGVNKVKGRYVRLYSNGNTSNQMNHYTEVEVYGK
jgi:hypothetical protein